MFVRPALTCRFSAAYSPVFCRVPTAVLLGSGRRTIPASLGVRSPFPELQRRQHTTRFGSSSDPPREIGRRYRGLYGYGRSFKILFLAVAVALAIPSVPVLSASTEGLFPYTLSLLFLALVAAWTIWVSVAAGFRTGLAAGLAAAASRVLALSVPILLGRGTAFTWEGLALFLGSSGTLVLLGWLPGTAKNAWSGPRVDL